MKPIGPLAAADAALHPGRRVEPLVQTGSSAGSRRPRFASKLPTAAATSWKRRSAVRSTTCTFGTSRVRLTSSQASLSTSGTSAPDSARWPRAATAVDWRSRAARSRAVGLASAATRSVTSRPEISSAPMEGSSRRSVMLDVEGPVAAVGVADR